MLNKTNIEWARNPVMRESDLDPKLGSSYDLGYTWNPITGCLNHTNGMCNGGNFPCYAYKLANTRLKERYLANINIAPIETSTHPSAMAAHFNMKQGQKAVAAFKDPFYPRFSEHKLHQPLSMTKPAGIFVCSMSDLFGIGVPEEWTSKIMSIIIGQPQHRFYLLTKQPQNLIKFSPFPDNAWVGVSVTEQSQFSEAWIGAVYNLRRIKAKVKFLSFEPLLNHIHVKDSLTLLGDRFVDWVIIGAQTKPTVMPQIEWVREIVEAADKAGIPVFLKRSLVPLYPKCAVLRQELPVR